MMAFDTLTFIMTMIQANLQTVRHRVEQAAHAAKRDPATVQLLAVSKTWGSDAVREAAAAGQRAFGENYIQEAVDKMAAVADLADLALEWHCIGPVQANKTRLVATHFDWVHTVDRLKIAQRLSEQRPAHLPPLNVCVQVNVDGGAQKSGVAPHEALPLALAVSMLPGLRLRGVMVIPEPAIDFVAQCALFESAVAIFDQIIRAGLPLDTLSMGMSNDLEAAVRAGSTLVRVGTAIFGGRV
jgi:PLP dependent protein